MNPFKTSIEEKANLSLSRYTRNGVRFPLLNSKADIIRSVDLFITLLRELLRKVKPPRARFICTQWKVVEGRPRIRRLVKHTHNGAVRATGRFFKREFIGIAGVVENASRPHSKVHGVKRRPRGIPFSMASHKVFPPLPSKRALSPLAPVFVMQAKKERPRHSTKRVERGDTPAPKRRKISVDDPYHFPTLPGQVQAVNFNRSRDLLVDMSSVSDETLVGLDWKHNFCGFSCAKHLTQFRTELFIKGCDILLTIKNRDYSRISNEVWVEHSLGPMRRMIVKHLHAIQELPLAKGLRMIEALRGFSSSHLIVHATKRSKRADKALIKTRRWEKFDFTMQMDSMFGNGMEDTFPRATRAPRSFTHRTHTRILNGASGFASLNNSISRQARRVIDAIASLYSDWKIATEFCFMPGGYKKNFRVTYMLQASAHFYTAVTGLPTPYTLFSKKIRRFFEDWICGDFEFQAIGRLKGVNVPLYFITALPLLMYGPGNWGTRFYSGLTGYHKMGGVSDKAGLLVSLASWLRWMWTTGVQCFEEKSFKPFYHTGASYSKWYMKSTELIAREPEFRLLEKSGGVSDFLTQVSDLEIQGKQIVEKLQNTTSPVLGTAQSIYQKLRMIKYDEELNSVARKTHAPPFAIGVYGSPKTGKTTLLEELMVLFAKIQGIDFNPARKYVRSAQDKFQSGLTNDHRYFVLDDMGAIAPSASGETAAASIHSFMEYFNSSTSATNQADLADKGKIFARPDFVMATSNVSDFGTANVSRVKFAFFRRLKYRVSLIVKEEYRPHPDANILDTTKIPDGVRDVHRYNVIEYLAAPIVNNASHDLSTTGAKVKDSQNDTADCVENIVLNNVEASVFFPWFVKAVTAHLKHNERLKSDDVSLMKSSYCAEHGMLSIRCGCSEVEKLTLDDFGFQGSCYSRVMKDVSLSFWNAGQSFVAFGKMLGSLRDFLNCERDIVVAFLDTFTLLFSAYFNSRYYEPTAVKDLRKSHQALTFTQTELASDASASESAKKTFTDKMKKLAGLPVLEHRNVLVAQSQNYQQWIKQMQDSAVDDTPDIYTQEIVTQWLGLRDQTRTLTLEALAKKVKVNMVMIRTFESDDTSVFDTCAGCVIHMNRIVTVGHVFHKVKYVAVRTTMDDKWRKALIMDCRPMLDRKTDVMVFSSPSPHQFKSLLPFVPTWIGKLGTVDKALLVRFGEDAITLPVSPVPKDFRFGDEAVKKYEAPGDLGPGSCGSITVAEIGGSVCMISTHQQGSVVLDVAVSHPLTTMTVLGGVAGIIAMLDVPLELCLKSNGLSLRKNLPFYRGVFHPKDFYGYYSVHFPERLAQIEKRITFLGTIPYGRSTPTTKIVPTALYGKIPPSPKVQPSMFTGMREDGTYQNWFNKGIEDLGDSFTEQDQEVLDKAVLHVIERFSDLARASGEKSYPLEERESLNGVAGVKFIDAFKINTGQGLPSRGPKSEHIYVTNGEKKYTAKGRQCVQYVADCLAAHKNPGIIGDFTLKDEAKKQAKAVRIFTQYPFAFNDIMRRIFLPVFKFIQDNPLLFGISIGINADSYQWKDLYKKHKKRPHHTLYDFRTYDKSHSSAILRGANQVLLSIALALFPEDFLICGHPWLVLAVAGLALTINPVYNVQNLIIQVLGSLGSGLFHTAIINSIIQHIILDGLWGLFIREYELAIKYNSASFMRYNSTDVYGDDGMNSSAYKQFNLPFMVKAAKEYLGLTLTSPDKSTVLPEDFPEESWSFLKRSFVMDGDNVLAPLEVNSILKTLNWWVPVKGISEEDAMIRRCDEAMGYMASHPWHEWNDLANKVHEGMCEAFGQRPKYKFFRSRREFREAAEPNYVRRYPKSSMATRRGLDPVENDWQYWGKTNDIGDWHSVARAGNRLAVPGDPVSSVYATQHLRGSEETPTSYTFFATSNVSNGASGSQTGLAQQANPDPAEVSNLVQSHDVSIMNPATTTDVTSFAVDTPVQEGFGKPAPGLGGLQGAPMNGKLDEFLSRPVLLKEYSWTSAAFLNTRLDPWAIFLNNAKVRNKISSFARLRATMNIEIQVNGTPFHFGAILASYEPANSWRTSVDGDWRQHSMLQHGFIDPTTSRSVNLTCPFIHPKFWIDLNDEYASRIGVVNLDSVVDLASSSGSVEPISINVYGWLTDVELCMPTSEALATFLPQSKKVTKKKRGPMVGKDEYEVKPNSGLISAPANAVSNFASKLVGVPIIGEFALATQIGASAVSSIASLFGYSRTLSLDAPMPILSQVVSRMAITDQVSNAVPLTVSSKAETSIDPRIVGLDTGEDELGVLQIASRPSLMSVTAIAISQPPGTDILFADVNPSSLSTTGTSGSDRYYNMSCLQFASIPFKYWTGTIVYRFQIVCSNYHRGRLKFQYIPQNSAPTFTDDLNDTYNHIVDISPGKEVEIVIPWCSPMPMLTVGTPHVPSPRNGTIRVSVQNEITSPDSTTAISLLSWVYAGEDFKVSVPTAQYYGSAELKGQSAHEVDDGETIYESVKFFDGAMGPGFDASIIGDPVVSFRPLMKRMTLQTASGDKLGGVCSLNQTIVRDIRFCAAPQRAGVCTYGNWQQASNPGTFGNTTYNHIVNYLEPCFLAKRGGFRWMINTGSAFSNLPLGSIAQDPLIFQSTVPNVFTQSMISSFNSPEQNLSLYDIIGSSALSITSPANYDNGMGTQVFSQGNDSQRPEVQVLPYFPYRYFNHLGTDANGYYPRQNINVRIAIKNKVGNSVNLMDGTVSMSVAAAEDFTMNVFVGVPVFYNLGYTNPFAPDLVTHSARIDPLP